jgi:hypothetical protein
MPGFVDVSNMTAREVRMMDHAADYDEPAGYQPRRQWKSRAKPEGIKHSVDNVWGAAVAAQRMNGSYVKETTYILDMDRNVSVVDKRRNRDIMVEILENPALLTVEDIAQGQECRRYLQNDITFRALKNRLTEFDGSVSKVLAVTEEFDTLKHKLELAVVACLPQSQARAQAREATQERVRQTSGNLIGTPSEKVTCNVEVVKCVFSQNWNTWYATAITQDNDAVFFSIRESYDAGTHLTIRGTVKAHRDGVTQLNRVSVI